MSRHVAATGARGLGLDDRIRLVEQAAARCVEHRAGIPRGSGAHGRLVAVCIGRSFGPSASAAGRATSEKIRFLLVVLFDVIGISRVSLLLIFVIDFISAVPEAIAVILVYRPAAVLLIFIIFEWPLSPAKTAEIVRIVVLGEPQRLFVLIAA